MEKKVYAGIIGICLLISTIVLILYYTQDFSSEIIFNENFSFTSDHTDYNINWIETPIGEITLKNKGIFTEKYILPNYVGCIKLKENSDAKITNYEFEIYLKGIEDNTIEVPIKKEINQTLFAKYYPHNSGVSFKMLEENVKKVLIYEIKKEEKNPLRTEYTYNYKTSQQLCERLEKEKTPIKIIELKII